MAIHAGRHQFGTDKGRITLRTFRDGLVAQAGHDLTIDAAGGQASLSWPTTCRPTSLARHGGSRRPGRARRDGRHQAADRPGQARDRRLGAQGPVSRPLSRGHLHGHQLRARHGCTGGGTISRRARAGRPVPAAAAPGQPDRAGPTTTPPRRSGRPTSASSHTQRSSARSRSPTPSRWRWILTCRRPRPGVRVDGMTAPRQLDQHGRQRCSTAASSRYASSPTRPPPSRRRATRWRPAVPSGRQARRVRDRRLEHRRPARRGGVRAPGDRRQARAARHLAHVRCGDGDRDRGAQRHGRDLLASAALPGRAWPTSRSASPPTATARAFWLACSQRASLACLLLP